jgi:two-component system, OmpR family, phosphate regulon response regulator PhoB
MSAAIAQRVLVVDDDAAVRALLSRYLEVEGYLVDEAGDGKEAMAAISRRQPDLVLLDVMMPGEDGLDVLVRLRKTSDVPVILLTARGEETDRVLGLKLGGDDYIVKPFSPAELTARIASVLRRGGGRATPSPRLEFDGLTLDLTTREVWLGSELVPATTKEFDLLVFLASSPRQVFSREQLLERVWGSSSAWQDPDTVTEHIRRIRRRIEKDPARPQWIRTVRGAGYRFEPR